MKSDAPYPREFPLEAIQMHFNVVAKTGLAIEWAGIRYWTRSH
jgi:hypothetical protein